MTNRFTSRRRLALLAIPLAMIGASATLAAQARALHVVGEDGRGVPYASVGISGGETRIADEQGIVALGATRGRAMKVEVRRMGYAPWEGSFDATDTSSILTIVMKRVPTTLATVRITDSTGAPATLALQGFYRRALDRQKGAGSGTFITPEEIDRHDPTYPTEMLQGRAGVQLKRSLDNRYVALGQNGTCKMTVVIDGMRVRSHAEATQGGGGGMSIGKMTKKTEVPTDDNSVFIDSFVSGHQLAAIEVYPRGGNIPIELQQSDQGCGLIAVWTGARR